VQPCTLTLECTYASYPAFVSLVIRQILFGLAYGRIEVRTKVWAVEAPVAFWPEELKEFVDEGRMICTGTGDAARLVADGESFVQMKVVEDRSTVIGISGTLYTLYCSIDDDFCLKWTDDLGNELLLGNWSRFGGIVTSVKELASFLQGVEELYHEVQLLRDGGMDAYGG